MDFRDLEAFVSITKLGSMTAAADYLHLSQPALSRRIQGIEEELDCVMFERVGMKMILTPAGKVFLQRCVSIMADMKETLREVNVAALNPRHFSIGMVDILAETRLTLKFRDFYNQYPAMEMHLHTAGNDKISELVANGQVDIGLRYFQVSKVKHVEQIKIGSERLVIIAASNTKLVPNPCNPRDLQNVRWITFPSGDGLGSILTSFLNFNLLSNNVTEGMRIEVGSLSAQKRLVAADFGLCFLPESSVEDEMNMKSLRIVTIPSFEVTIPIMAIYRTSSAVIDLIENFIDITSI